MQESSLEKFYESAITFLDYTRYFKILRQQCEVHQENGKINKEHCIFQFTVPISVLELTELCADLGNLLLLKPNRARNVFRDVIFISIKVLNLLTQDISCSQISVMLRLNSLPTFPEFTIMGLSDLTLKMKDTKFFRFQGIVSTISVPINYTQSARYQCVNKQCPGSCRNDFIRVHIPGATESEIVGKGFVCCYCCGSLEEDKRCRILGEKIEFGMVPVACIASCQIEVVRVCCRDDLCHEIHLGCKYSIIGVPSYRCINNTYFPGIEANNILHVERTRSGWNIKPLLCTCKDSSEGKCTCKASSEGKT